MKKYITSFIVLCVIAIMVISCVTHNEKIASTDKLIATHDYDLAYNELNDNKEKIYHKKKDTVLYLLDSGALAFHANHYTNALDHLSNADRQMEAIRKKNIGEQIGASIINDSLITYNGYNYEYIFTSILLSMGYLQQNKFDSGFVEIRRSQDKLKKIQVDNKILVSEYNKNSNTYVSISEDTAIPFVDSAFIRMLSFWLYRADRDITNMEVAARKYQEAIAAQPQLYPFTPPPITDEQFSTNNNYIQVIALTDRNPILYSKRFSLNAVSGGFIISTHNSLQNLDNNLTPVGDDSFVSGLGLIPIPGMPASGFSVVFATPEMAKFNKKINRIEVWSTGEQLGTLTLTESLENIAIQTFEEEKKYIYGRQISRVILKSLAGIASNEVDPLLGFVSQIFNNVTEQADLRIGRYFPAHIWTGDFAVKDTGNITITLKYFLNSTLIKEHTLPVSITGNNDVFNLVVDSLL